MSSSATSKSSQSLSFMGMECRLCLSALRIGTKLIPITQEASFLYFSCSSYLLKVSDIKMHGQTPEEIPKIYTHLILPLIPKIFIARFRFEFQKFSCILFPNSLLIKKKIKFFSYLRKFGMEQLQSHI
jgi:hypothetical protein